MTLASGNCPPMGTAIHLYHGRKSPKTGMSAQSSRRCLLASSGDALQTYCYSLLTISLLHGVFLVLDSAARSWQRCLSW